jgi:hypothetical protein
MGTEGSYFGGQNNCGVKLTTHLYLVLRLRMSGAIPPPQYVFMAWCLIKQEILLDCKVLS